MSNDQEIPPAIKVAPRVNLSLNSIYQTVMLAIASLGMLAALFAAYYSLDTRLADHAARIKALEAQMEDLHKANIDFQTEMRNAIAQANQTLSDLRVALAAKGYTK